MLNLKESWSPLPKDCLKPADKGLRGRVTGFSLMFTTFSIYPASMSEMSQTTKRAGEHL